MKLNVIMPSVVAPDRQVVADDKDAHFVAVATVIAVVDEMATADLASSHLSYFCWTRGVCCKLFYCCN